ncbi:MAG: sugar ABC transporter substrate-binding protein, partial [Promicromonosporaceae bacterium]|nr:sugar ABC transporter substrate-binding protein [Promicromonosporaceae bacterium]
AFLGSTGCQDLIGESGVVFPAISSSSELAMEARASRGHDSFVFQEMADAGEVYMIPRFRRAGEVNQIMQDAFQAIATGADVRSTIERAANEAQEMENN